MGRRVRHSHFGTGELVQTSDEGVSLVCWSIERKSWVRYGWYDLEDEAFDVESEKLYDGNRILSTLRRKASVR